MTTTKRALFERRFRQEMGTRQNYGDTKLRVQQNDPRRMELYWLRRRVFDREWFLHRQEPKILRLAHGLAMYLLEKPVWLEDDLLAGVYGFTEYRHSTPFSFTEAFEAYRDDGGDFDAALVEQAIRMTDAGMAGIGSGLHVVGGFRRALSLGVSGMRRALTEAAAGEGETDFRRAALLTLDAFTLYVRRCADEAKMLAVRLDTGPQRRAALTELARACDWVATEPPETFREALQLVALLHEVISTEERCGSLSFGRLDKYLFPYYRRDVAAGILTPEEAQALIDSFWLKLAANRWGWQNVTLGGWDSEEGFCWNAVTRMCLDASRRLRRDQPQVTFRCHPTMPDEAWEDVISLLKLGLGFPSLYNDEQCIAAKERVGIPRRDAEEYGILGCVELTIPEKEYSHSEGMRINWPKLLEVALHGGLCPLTGLRFPQKEPRPLDSFRDFEDFLAWFEGEFLFYVDILARAADEMHTAYCRHYPIPFLSATMEGCAESGRDATEGGTIYNHSCINTAGQANLVDSLAAIKEFVFEEGLYTLPELAELLRSNFAGREAERHHLMDHCPRFGSDDSCTALMTRLHELYCDYLIHLPNKRGGVREVGYYSVEAQVYFGEATGALPDGRGAGEVLSNGTAAVQGTERHGPLTVLRSVAAMDCSCLGNGMAMDMKFHPQFFANPEHSGKFRQAVETYFQLGGMQLQVNVVDKATLEEAQREPEKHRNLVVRVSGFSAYFGDLSRGVQDEIIRRTEFGG